MNFQETDRLQLARRVVEHLAVPGAADVAVRDVAFRRGATGHQYLFTLAYTLGTADHSIRCERAAGFVEGKGDVPPRLVLPSTDNEPTLVEQYEDVAAVLGLSPGLGGGHLGRRDFPRTDGGGGPPPSKK